VPAAHKRASAKRDLIEHYVCLAEHGGVETAERFGRMPARASRNLSRNPRMGAPLSWRSPKVAGLRFSS